MTDPVAEAGEAERDEAVMAVEAFDAHESGRAGRGELGDDVQGDRRGVGWSDIGTVCRKRRSFILRRPTGAREGLPELASDILEDWSSRRVRGSAPVVR